MAQKPTLAQLNELSQRYDFFIDTGIWLLSLKAIRVLAKLCGWDAQKQQFIRAVPEFFDLYTTFGEALGTDPTKFNPSISELSSAVVYLPQGKFFHFGSSAELVGSSLGLQNLVTDQRQILSRTIKPHPSLFVQNSLVEQEFREEQGPLWIENSFLPKTWSLKNSHVLTGIPQNSWNIQLPQGTCVDVVPLSHVPHDGSRQQRIVFRPYGMYDSFRGNPRSAETQWLNRPLSFWFTDRTLKIDHHIPEGIEDIYELPLFPVVSAAQSPDLLLQWLIDFTVLSQEDAEMARESYLSVPKLSAAEISDFANLDELEKQRHSFRVKTLTILAKNASKSVFYQLDLRHAAKEWKKAGLPDLSEVDSSYPLEHRIQNAAFRYALGNADEKTRAFKLLKETILLPIQQQPMDPRVAVEQDQIVWARSPVRIDLAGGWTDTPPYCLLEGGRVVNIGLNLNGQPPIQVFLKPNSNFRIILRSIDLGTQMEVTTFEQLTSFSEVGSAFSIPLAALCLTGFHPTYSTESFPNLLSLLHQVGSGVEITFMAAVPKGSGLGTSSILAATMLGGLSNFFDLGWTRDQISQRTLALEQLLTTGGGWQDQFGGLYSGVKLISSHPGMFQEPIVEWLPDQLFVRPEYLSSMVLYYTGITRTAKGILEEIVQNMFLNEHEALGILSEMKSLARVTASAINTLDYHTLSECIGESWELNNRLDKDTSNTEIDRILARVEEYCLGYKLAGAGGGGYLLLMGKTPDHAQKIRSSLRDTKFPKKGRIVDFCISDLGLEVTRS